MVCPVVSPFFTDSAHACLIESISSLKKKVLATWKLFSKPPLASPHQGRGASRCRGAAGGGAAVEAGEALKVQSILWKFLKAFRETGVSRPLLKVLGQFSWLKVKTRKYRILQAEHQEGFEFHVRTWEPSPSAHVDFHTLSAEHRQRHTEIFFLLTSSSSPLVIWHFLPRLIFS